jgi:branched-subunit amino acid aminotransferase/4-amino-4-deoxychorismate lyase
LDAHIARLLDAAQALKMEVPATYNLEYFKKQVCDLVVKNNITAGGKCRLTLFRNAGGTYTPDDNGVGYVIETYTYGSNNYVLNEEGFHIELYPEMRKPVNKLSIYKTCNSLLYIMAGIYARQHKYDDTLIGGR